MECKQQRKRRIAGGPIRIHIEVPAFRNTFTLLFFSCLPGIRQQWVMSWGMQNSEMPGVRSASHPAPWCYHCRVRTRRDLIQLSQCLQVSAATFPSIPMITNIFVLIPLCLSWSSHFHGLNLQIPHIMLSWICSCCIGADVKNGACFIQAWLSTW